MHPALSTLTLISGAVLIALVIREMFHVVFHPVGKGLLSSWIPRLVWRAAKATRVEQLLGLCGPLSLALVIVVWALLLATGWALIYWTQMPGGFLYTGSLQGEQNAGFIAAFYVSAVTLTTLGYGDILPLSDVLRPFAPLEAALGFSLITAALSWVLSLHQAVLRRRSFAHRINLISREQTDVLAEEDRSSLLSLLRSLTERLTIVRQDLLQFPISYYFHSSRRQESLPSALVHLRQLMQPLRRRGGRPLVVSIDELAQALSDYADALEEVTPRMRSTRGTAVLEAYYADHCKL